MQLLHSLNCIYCVNLRNNKTELEKCLYTFKTHRTVCCKKRTIPCKERTVPFTNRTVPCKKCKVLFTNRTVPSKKSTLIIYRTSIWNYRGSLPYRAISVQLPLLVKLTAVDRQISDLQNLNMFSVKLNHKITKCILQY